MKRRDILKYLPVTAIFLLAAPFTAQAATGWQQDGNQNWTYVEDDKKLTNQWVPWSDGTLRYVGGNGLIVTNNWVTYEGSRYRVKEDGTRYENAWFSVTSTPTLPSSSASTLWYYAGPDGRIYTNGWYEIGGQQYYFYQGGNSPRKAFFNLEDKRYYVDENGARPAPGWFSVSGTDSRGNAYTNWYYVQADGSLLRDGWHEVDGKTCYFDANGLNYRKRWVNLEENRYYVDDEGDRQEGWFAITGVNANGQEYSNWYYADANGAIWRGGWAELAGNWYYFDANGLNYRKRWYTDGRGERYYLDEDGVLPNDGWFKIENVNSSTGAVTENWYYAQASGAVLKDGYKELDGHTYYFDANGYNYRNRWITLENGNRRYLGEDGVLKKDEWFVISGKDSRNSDYHNWYYAGSDGNVIMDKWYKIDGEYYCFNASGVMRTGWLTESAEEADEDDSYYYCGEDGARVTGWQYLEIPDNWSDDEDVEDYINEHGTTYAWFYFSRNGKKKYSSGGKREMNVDGVTYCFDDDGIMHYGWVKLSGTTPEMEGYRYFYEPKSEKDQTYILGEKVESAWLNIVGPSDLGGSGVEAWFYLDTSGKPVCGKENDYEVEKIHDDYYVFDMYGEAQYGLIEVDGDFYYCGTEAGDRKCVTGKTSLSDGIDSGTSEYYFDTKGKGITGIKDGSFYYQGKLQKADRTARYEMFDIPGTGRRLVNSSGEIVKGRKVTDGNDQKWEVSSGGAIRVYGSDETAEIVAPEATTSY